MSEGDQVRKMWWSTFFNIPQPRRYTNCPRATSPAPPPPCMPLRRFLAYTQTLMASSIASSGPVSSRRSSAALGPSTGAWKPNTARWTSGEAARNALHIPCN